MVKISENTELASLNLRFFNRVLEDVFLWPPPNGPWERPPNPELVRDLVGPSLMPLEKVIQKLQELVKYDGLLQVHSADLLSGSLLVGDAWLNTTLNAGADHPGIPLGVGSARMDLLIVPSRGTAGPLPKGFPEPVVFHAWDFRTLAPVLRSVNRGIFTARDPDVAYSAAMQLRQQGLSNTYFLCTQT